MESKSVTKGVIAALISFFFLSSLGVLVKLSGKEGGGLWWILFIQYATALILALVISARERFKNLKPANYKYEFIRASVGMISFACFAFAATEASLVDASLLQNTAPIFIPIIALVWLKDTIEKRIWIGVVIGFIGIIFIIRPDSTVFKAANIIGLTSGILLAVAYIAMKIITKTDGFKTILFYYSVTAVIISAPFGIINWTNPPLMGWIYAICSGVSLIIYLNMLQYAYKHIEPNKLSPFNYTVVLFTGLLDWWIFNHIPGFMTLIGMAIVCTGGIIAIIHHEKNNRELKHSWH